MHTIAKGWGSLIAIATQGNKRRRRKMGAAGSVRRAARQEKEQMHEKTLDREVYRHSLEESLGDHALYTQYFRWR